MDALNYFIYFLLLLTSIWLLSYILYIIQKKSRITQSLKNNTLVHLEIKVPNKTNEGEGSMENVLSTLNRILSERSTLSLEIILKNQYLHFYVTTEKTNSNIVISQIYSNYTDAEIQEVEDPIKISNKSFIQLLKFKHSSINKIKTYKDKGDDFLQNFSALASKADMNDEIVIQFILKKIENHFWNKNIKFWYPSLTKKTKKIQEEVFEGNLRLVYSSTNDISYNKKTSIPFLNLFRQFRSKTNELTKARNPIFFNQAILVKTRSINSSELWGTDEIASIFHLSTSSSKLSNVVNTTSKKAPAPNILPISNNFNDEKISIFGKTNYRNESKTFGILREDRRKHLYIVGKTGSGKSKLLELLLIEDIINGKGCCLIDPHGDSANELLKYVPKERIGDVVLIDPTDRDFPIGFNPLGYVEDYETRQHITTFFIAIFKKLFSYNWHARMEHLIRYITLALLETRDSNLLGISRMLNDTKYRQRVVSQIQDPIVKNFWTNEFAGWNERFSNDAIIPLTNKMGQFIANPIIRNIVGQQKNSLNFEDFMNDGKIVIINLSKGLLGDENTALLGSMFITKIQQAALSRAKTPENERRDFYFYIDEFQNFATDAFTSILSESRKYHLNLTLAHQYISQLPDEIKATAFGNVGSLVTFSIGGDDAAYLSKEYSPTFTADDLITLNSREMYIKMSINGKSTPPFSATTIDIPKVTSDFTREIINKSRLTYGKNRVSVENEIANWTRVENYKEKSSNEDFPEPII